MTSKSTKIPQNAHIFGGLAFFGTQHIVGLCFFFFFFMAIHQSGLLDEYYSCGIIKTHKDTRILLAG